MKGTVCEVCGKYRDITEFCGKHHEKTNKAVCEYCLGERLELGTHIMGGEHDDISATILIEFADSVFTDICYEHQLLSLELGMLGYNVTHEFGNYATIEYGPSVIRRLKGLPDPGDAINGVMESIWNLLWE